VIHALDAEQAVLGAVLLNPQWIDHAQLAPAHFYDPTHAALWEEMQQRYRDGRLIDTLALRGFAAETFKELGGVAYLVKLMDQSAAMSAQVAGYGEIVRDCARRRAVTVACGETIALAKEGGQDVLALLEQRLQEIASTDADADAWEKLGVIACEAVERAELGEAVAAACAVKKGCKVTFGGVPEELEEVVGDFEDDDE
jgi:replicative DNA helicase